MKKQTKQLIILAALLVALGGAYAGLRIWNSKSDERESVKTTYVAQMDDVTKLSFEAGYGELSFTRLEKYSWSYDGDADLPLSYSKLNAIVNTLASMTAVNVIEDPDALADYGLQEPRGRVYAEDEDGTQISLLLGDNFSDDTYCYAMYEGGSEVYSIDCTIKEKISCELLDLMELPRLSTIDKDTFQTAELTDGDTVHTVEKATSTYDQQVEKDTGETDENGNAIYEAATETVTQYSWSCDGTGIDPEAQGLKDWLSAVGSLNPVDCYVFKAGADDLAEYGFDSTKALRLTLMDDGEEETVLLTFGGTDAELNIWYFVIGEAKSGCNIYSVSLEDARAALTIDAGALSAAEEAA